ncbi:MAG: AMP-binding protein [Pseudomonadota bacterium]
MHAEFDRLAKVEANHVALSPLSYLDRAALVFPERTSIIHGARRYTWGETRVRCRCLASALSARGIGLGDTVSILAPNTPEMTEAHFGVPLAGAVLNPINTRLEAETIAYILEHSDARVLLVDSQYGALAKAALVELGRDLLVVDISDSEGPPAAGIGSLDYEALLAEGDPEATLPTLGDEWQAITINYTSGTTGRPKGAVYHHRGAYLMAMGTVVAWEMAHHPVYLAIVPQFHCNGWCHAWAIALMAGTIVCTREVNAAHIYNSISDHGVNFFGGAPVVLQMLVDAKPPVKRDLPHPVKVFTAAAPPPQSVLEAMAALGFAVTHVYGLTESYGHVTQCLWRDEWEALSGAEAAAVASRQGVPFPMFEAAQVFDREAGTPVPADGETQGEIALRGNTVMKGYYKAPEATAEAFANGWYWSGDAAVMHPNGYIQIRDRLKDVIISGGENVSSIEVENVLYAHPAVAAAAVVARPDDKWGETPCAFVEVREDAGVSEDDILEFCRARLAGFKRPKTVIFAELPKTSTGKIQKFVLRAQARDLGSA